MKYYTFYRESNKFDDIVNDIVIKKYVDEVITWKNFLRLGIVECFENKVNIHITLKYGDEMRNQLTNKDYKPIMGIDYIPNKDT